MRPLLLTAIALLYFLTSCEQARKSPHESVSTENIKVTYGRPYKKGREIFGGLQPYGKVWRTGADEATLITFSKDVSFAGKPVKAGTYSLYTVPNRDTWTIILNNETGQSGLEYDRKKDLVRVDVPSKKLDNIVEQLTIRFEPGKIIIEWDRTQVAVPVE